MSRNNYVIGKAILYQFFIQILDFAAPYFCTEASNSRNVFFHYNLISKC